MLRHGDRRWSTRRRQRQDTSPPPKTALAGISPPGLIALLIGTVLAAGVLTAASLPGSPQPVGGAADGDADEMADLPAATSPSPSDMSVYEPMPDCEEATRVPLGQSPDAVNFEPLGSIWCFDLSEPPSRTVVEGPNSWVDDFTVDQLMLRLDDGDMGYRVYDATGAAVDRGQHWINQNHWMVDARRGFTGGTSMRPDRSFTFEDDKLVVEGDFAASIPEYGGRTWGEITITSASAPTGEIADKSYAYGQFGGHWAVGCRLQGTRRPICAVEGPEPTSPPSEGGCSAIPGKYRVLEISWTKPCGDQTYGGAPWGELADYWRECEPEGMDMACRDRFRMEVTRDSITLFVNGVKYYQDAGWPATHQLPDSFLDGDVYVYQSNWQNRAGDHAFRYHWDHFAVNPPTGPTASPLFS